MNIHTIHTLPGQQNLIHSGGESSTAPSSGTLHTIAPSNGGAALGKPEPCQTEAHKVTALINSLQKDLETDPNVVLYPPFFPIATFQRLDVIAKIRGVGDEIRQSSLDEGLKATISGDFLKNSATDREISAAIKKLFSLRDQLVEKGWEVPEEINPGLILSIEA